MAVAALCGLLPAYLPLVAGRLGCWGCACAVLCSVWLRASGMATGRPCTAPRRTAQQRSTVWRSRVLGQPAAEQRAAAALPEPQLYRNTHVNRQQKQSRRLAL